MKGTSVDPLESLRRLDREKIAAFRAAPHDGPRILFFSGGSALKELSRALIQYTHNSIHIITPFDSGGSSAELRRAFRMPAVGDIRNRLTALIDPEKTGSPEILALFTSRLPKDEPKDKLLKELADMAAGRHRLVSAVPDPVRSVVRRHLELFVQRLPEEFHPQGASIGNLLLTAGYLEHGRCLDAAIDLYSGLLGVRGRVRPVLDADLQLTAVLEDGSMIQGQHLLTGKQSPPIASRVREMSLDREYPDPVQDEISCELRAWIGGADLICYPMGSLFSSLIANLLPGGVAASIAGTSCPKVFIPNTFHDPESFGLTLTDQVGILFSYLQRGVDVQAKTGKVLDYLLLDTDTSRYHGSLDTQLLERHEVVVLKQELVTQGSTPRIDPRRLLPILLSLSSG